MFTLIVLAYNEEKYIEKTIKESFNHFDEVIIVNDSSKDETLNKINKLELQDFNNLKIINNEKNIGAGKSFLNAIKEVDLNKTDYLIKIDGDNQFKIDDILKLKKVAKDNKIDFLKCDRFWEDGIEGNIPIIRFIGNAFASFLLKLSTSNWKLNDPLNGLFLISSKALRNFDLPKLFYRYGYPFFLSVYFSNLSIEDNLKIGQVKNTVTYRDEKSNLKAFTMLFKLLYFTLKTLVTKIKIKIKYSKLQMSGILDFLGLGSFVTFCYSLTRFIQIRYFDYYASQATWFLVTLIFFSISIGLIYVSQKIEYELKLSNFYNED